MTTSLQAESSHARRRELGPRVCEDSKDKQGRSHQQSDSHGEGKKRSDMKACHVMNQQSTNDTGLQMDTYRGNLPRVPVLPVTAQKFCIRSIPSSAK
jgi:hypothetical protein